MKNPAALAHRQNYLQPECKQLLSSVTLSIYSDNINNSGVKKKKTPEDNNHEWNVLFLFLPSDQESSLWCQGRLFKGGNTSEGASNCITSSAEASEWFIIYLVKTDSQTLVKTPERHPESCPCSLHWAGKVMQKHHNLLWNREEPALWTSVCMLFRNSESDHRYKDKKWFPIRTK